ncbi:Hypothetical predicted protein [Mytilus galloprovincialis]|uniref:Uncharacterized protein n=1 Tax=Mytilus galloprovincialis TaxID=29158 RepID=A0A8B6DMN3_MYTGA|nr:Hypothetical predicted protein [Mytilus galloprovincialis]
MVNNYIRTQSGCEDADCDCSRILYHVDALQNSGQLVKQRCRRCSQNLGTHEPTVGSPRKNQNYSLVTSTSGHMLQLEQNELYELNEKISNEERCSSCIDVNGYLSDSEKRTNGSL